MGIRQVGSKVGEVREEMGCPRSSEATLWPSWEHTQPEALGEGKCLLPFDSTLPSWCQAPMVARNVHSDISQATAWLQPELLIFNSPRGWNGSWALRAPSSEDLSPPSLPMSVLPQYQYHCFHFQVSLFG